MKYIVEVIVWGYPLMIVLIVASIYFAIKTKLVQLRYLKYIPKLLFEKRTDKNKISAFQSVSLILANHVGTGNIIGVAVAIMYGGPGSVFWMWVTALLGSGLSFIENTLGQMYKNEINGEYRGGVAYYIYYGIGSKIWAHIIAFVFFICLGLLMPTIQSATIATTMNNTFFIPKVYIALFVSITIGIIIFGKTRRIVQVSEVIVPFMALSYILVTLIIIGLNISKLNDVIILIFNSALNKNALYAGIMGSAISYGIRRGLFSNEAGIGASPNISASSEVSHPVKQGLLSSFCVFFDTLIICTLTAFMILITDCYNVVDGDKVLYTGLKNYDYSHFTVEAINTLFINSGQLFISKIGRASCRERV